jgi:hypothetical protein
MDWRARPSTLPRRQGRAGRHYDFAQWYPRIAVYDAGGWQTQPLLPQGEFFGEFGSYDVTLEVAADQVIGATGLPVEGDPGWRPVAGGTTPTSAGYPDRERRPLGLLGETRAPGEPAGALESRGRAPLRLERGPGLRGGERLRRRSGGEGGIAVHVLFRPVDEGLGERCRAAAYHRRARSSTSDVRAVPLAAAHQPAAHRERRDRVPDADDERLSERGAHRPRDGAPVPARHPRQQRVARRVAGRGASPIS